MCALWAVYKSSPGGYAKVVTATCTVKTENPVLEIG